MALKRYRVSGKQCILTQTSNYSIKRFTFFTLITIIEVRDISPLYERGLKLRRPSLQLLSCKRLPLYERGLKRLMWISLITLIHHLGVLFFCDYMYNRRENKKSLR